MSKQLSRIFTSSYTYYHITALVGVALRLISVWRKPLWIDEQSSLIYASQYSFGQIVGALPDIHPGGYYVLLKLSMFFIRDIHVLRLLLSVIPQIFAIVLLSIFLRKTLVQSWRKTVLFGMLFWLNPFFIFMSWQLRMYGFVFLFSVLICIGYIRLLRKCSWKDMFLLAGGLIAGISVSTSFYFFIPGIFWVFYKKRLFKRYFHGWILFAYVLLVQTFLYIVNHSFLELRDNVDWIPGVTIANLPSVILTSFGLFTATGLPKSMFIQSLIPAYTFLCIAIFCFFYIHSHSRIRYTITPGIFYYVLVISISLLFPIFSQVIFIRRFIPDISFFLPRILLPAAIWILIVVFMYLDTFLRFRNRIHKLLVILFIIFLLGFWSYSIQYFVRMHLGVKQYQVPIGQFKNTYDTNVIFWPPWSAFTQISAIDDNELSYVQKIADSSNIFSNWIFTQQHPSCRSSGSSKYRMIILYNQTLESDARSKEKVNSYLTRCCFKLYKNSESKEFSRTFTSFLCR